jgi:hypothetical protein
MAKSSFVERNKAVREAWNKELELVQEGKGTREWTQEQQKDILEKGRAYDEKGKAFEGQHMKSAEMYPEYQGEPGNIQFLTRAEHFEAHDCNWQNPTNWYYNPITKEKFDFGDGPFMPCEIIHLPEPIVSIQLTQENKNKESLNLVKSVNENKTEDTVEIGVSHVNTQPKNSKEANLSEVGFGQNLKRRIKTIGKSIVKFSAKHPTMTKVIKGAGIVAATIVTTKIAESTKSGEFSSKNGLSYDNENTDYTGYQADEVEQNRAVFTLYPSFFKISSSFLKFEASINQLPKLLENCFLHTSIMLFFPVNISFPFTAITFKTQSSASSNCLLPSSFSYSVK